MIVEKYDWERIAEQTLEVYKRAQGTRAQEHKGQVKNSCRSSRA